MNARAVLGKLRTPLLLASPAIGLLGVMLSPGEAKKAARLGVRPAASYVVAIPGGHRRHPLTFTHAAAVQEGGKGNMLNLEIQKDEKHIIAPEPGEKQVRYRELKQRDADKTIAFGVNVPPASCAKASCHNLDDLNDRQFGKILEWEKLIDAELPGGSPLNSLLIEFIASPTISPRGEKSTIGETSPTIEMISFALPWYANNRTQEQLALAELAHAKTTEPQHFSSEKYPHLLHLMANPKFLEQHGEDPAYDMPIFHNFITDGILRRAQALKNTTVEAPFPLAVKPLSYYAKQVTPSDLRAARAILREAFANYRKNHVFYDAIGSSLIHPYAAEDTEIARVLAAGDDILASKELIGAFRKAGRDKGGIRLANYLFAQSIANFAKPDAEGFKAGIRTVALGSEDYLATFAKLWKAWRPASPEGEWLPYYYATWAKMFLHRGAALKFDALPEEYFTRTIRRKLEILEDAIKHCETQEKRFEKAGFSKQMVDGVRRRKAQHEQELKRLREMLKTKKFVVK